MAELATEGEHDGCGHALSRNAPSTIRISPPAEDAGYLEATGRYVPHVLSFLQQLMEYHKAPPLTIPRCSA